MLSYLEIYDGVGKMSDSMFKSIFRFLLSTSKIWYERYIIVEGESREEYKFLNVNHLIDVAIKLLSLRTSKEYYIYSISIFKIIFTFLLLIYTFTLNLSFNRYVIVAIVFLISVEIYKRSPI